MRLNDDTARQKRPVARWYQALPLMTLENQRTFTVMELPQSGTLARLAKEQEMIDQRQRGARNYFNETRTYTFAHESLLATGNFTEFLLSAACEEEPAVYVLRRFYLRCTSGYAAMMTARCRMRMASRSESMSGSERMLRLGEQTLESVICEKKIGISFLVHLEVHSADNTREEWCFSAFTACSIRLFVTSHKIDGGSHSADQSSRG